MTVQVFSHLQNHPTFQFPFTRKVGQLSKKKRVQFGACGRGTARIWLVSGVDQGRETLLFSQNFRFTFNVLQNFPFRICTGRMQEWRDKGKERWMRELMQEMRDAGQEGCKRWGMQDRRVARDEGCRAGVMPEMRDAGQEGCKRWGMQDRRDACEEIWRKLVDAGKKACRKGGCRKGEMHEMRETRKEGERKGGRQERRDAGNEGLGQRRMQERRDREKEWCRKVEIHETRDAGKEGCRKGRIYKRRDQTLSKDWTPKSLIWTELIFRKMWLTFQKWRVHSPLIHTGQISW